MKSNDILYGKSDDERYTKEYAVEPILKYIPEDWGILKIGNSSYRGEYYPVNKYFGYMKTGTAFGSHSYIVKIKIWGKYKINIK